MKIYDKTLQEIFKEMVWQYKIIVVVGSVFLAFVLCYVPYKLFTFNIITPSGPEQLFFSESTTPVTFAIDPSLDSDGENVYMTFTRSTFSKTQPPEILLQPYIAKSATACKTWSIIE